MITIPSLGRIRFDQPNLLDVLDSATHYEFIGIGNALIKGREYCPTCGRTIAITSELNSNERRTTFNQAHMRCLIKSL